MKSWSEPRLLRGLKLVLATASTGVWNWSQPRLLPPRPAVLSPVIPLQSHVVLGSSLCVAESRHCFSSSSIIDKDSELACSSSEESPASTPT